MFPGGKAQKKAAFRLPGNAGDQTSSDLRSMRIAFWWRSLTAP